MKNIKWLLAIICLSVSVIGCEKEKHESQYSGKENNILSLTLTQGGKTYKAAIIGDEIVITKPNAISLNGANGAMVISENATVSPTPEQYTKWDDETEFTVKSFNGESKSYKYIVKLGDVTHDGDVVLETQTEVDEFAALEITHIEGSLTIGKEESEEKITSIEALGNLRKVAYDLKINNSYTGTEIVFDELEVLGALYIYNAPNVAEISMPKLTNMVLGMTINNDNATKVNFPILTEVNQAVTISAAKMEQLDLNELTTVGGNFSLAGGNSPQYTLSLPKLEEINGMFNCGSMTFKDITLPKLSSVTDIYFTKITANSIKVDAITESKKKIMITDCKLEELSFAKLQSNTQSIEYASCSVKNYNFPELSSATSIMFMNSPGEETFKFPRLKQLGSLILKSSKIENLKGFEALENLKSLTLEATNTLKSLSDLSALTVISNSFTVRESEIDFAMPAALESIKTITTYGETKGKLNVKGVKIGTLFLNGGSGLAVTTDKVFEGIIHIDMSANVMVESVEEIIGAFKIQGTAVDKEMNFVPNLRKVTGYIQFPSYISKISLPNLEEVSQQFTLGAAISTEVNLSKLKKVGTFFSLDVRTENCRLEWLHLPALESVGGDFTITADYAGADNVTTFKGVKAPALTTIGGTLQITITGQNIYNYSLQNLDGFSSLTSLRGVNIDKMKGLTDYSGLQGLFPNFTGSWSVKDNAYNPTLQDMKDGKFTKE